METWWEKFSGRLQFELQALTDAGIKHALREPDFAAGRVVLDLEMDASVFGGPSNLKLEVIVPETYPYFRPIVIAPQLDLRHHQHAFDRNLCLLGRRSDEWVPQMTIASLITNQLPLVIRANSDQESVNFQEIEEIQGEPISAYYRYDPNSACFVDGSWPLPETDEGQAEIAFSFGNDGVKAHVVRLLTSSGTGLSSGRVTPPLDGYKRVVVRWFRLDSAPRIPDAGGILSEVVRQHPRAAAIRNTYGLDLILVGYPEELSHRRDGAGWLLLAREPKKSRGRVVNPTVKLVRAHRAGPSDMAARVPEWPAMRNMRIAVFGVGCVGAPIALELARIGAKQLWLVDDDIVDAGATVRWPFGLDQVGHAKVDSLSAFIRYNYPYTQVARVRWRIGSAPPAGGMTESKILREIIGNVDIIVDATAEYGVQYFLSDLALENELPYVSAHGTHGGYGGEILSLKKGATGCWMCLAWTRADATIPAAPAMTADCVQPAGCEARTFLGASFDLSEVSLEAVRAVVQIALGDEIVDAHVRLLRLRDEANRRILPSWRGYPLPPHSSCTMCRARA